VCAHTHIEGETWRQTVTETKTERDREGGSAVAGGKRGGKCGMIEGKGGGRQRGGGGEERWRAGVECVCVGVCV
jgi:hypothetical protein